MDTNSKQSTDKTYSGMNCLIIGVLFGLFAVIWLPTPEVDAVSRIFGIVRDADTNNSLPGVAITVNDVFSTESNGPPNAGEYSIDYPGCNFSLRAILSGYKPFETEDDFCPEEFELELDIELTSVPLTSSIELREPEDNSQPEPVTVFRWTRSKNADSYRLIIATDESMEPVVFTLPNDEDKKKIEAPQAAVRLGSELDGGFTPHFWRVIGLDQAGDPVEQSQEVFRFSFDTDDRGFAVISGLVQSDRNLLGLAGAKVALLGEHAQTANNIVISEFRGEYIVIALTKDSKDRQLPFPIKILSTKDGFKPTTKKLKTRAELDEEVDLLMIGIGVRAEIIGTWSNGIWYLDVAASEWTKMTSSTPTGDIAAGDFTDDGKADVASIWASGLFYQDGATLDWTKVPSTAPISLTAGDVTGDGQAEIIGTWSNGIWYYDLAASKWTQMTASTPTGDIAAGDFTGDGKADVASSWASGLFYQDGATLAWTKVGTAPDSLTAGDVTGDNRSEIIGTWSDGIWYYDLAASKWTKMTSNTPTGDIAAGDFTGDGKADVASIWANELWYQDGATLAWTKVPGTAPVSLTAGDVTGQ